MATLLWLVGCAGALLAAVPPAAAESETEPVLPPCYDYMQDLLQGQETLRKELMAIREQLASLQPKLEECPPQWTTFNESCFRIGAENKTAADAAEVCKLMHPRARLASLELDHRYKVQHELLDISPFERFWIGLKRVDGGWRWSDGSMLDDAGEWHPTQPDNNGGEDCVQYDRTGRYPGWTFGWSDERCVLEAGFVCMIKLDV